MWLLTKQWDDLLCETDAPMYLATAHDHSVQRSGVADNRKTSPREARTRTLQRIELALTASYGRNDAIDLAKERWLIGPAPLEPLFLASHHVSEIPADDGCGQP